MPIRLWREILPAKTLLGAGLELGLNPFIGSTTAEGKAFGYNSLETVRGAAAAFLEQGADRVYLFNYMDSQTAIEDLSEYPVLLRECGSLQSLRGKSRRHVVTYTDTRAPGEARGYLLPARIEARNWAAFRVGTGPAPAAGLKSRVRVGLEGDPAGWQVRVNNAETRPVGVENADGRRPWPAGPVYAFDVPRDALRDGETVVEVTAPADRGGTIRWVEIAHL